MGKAIKINDRMILRCPDCGSHYLHHGEISIFHRMNGEDSKSMSVTVEGDKVHVNGYAIPGGNPSCRRDGIKIAFNCENCQAVEVLLIIQHKGQTFIEWEREELWTRSKK